MNIKLENMSPRFVESILLMSLLISLTALSIDTMLPALPEIGRDLHVQFANDVQLIISMLILGLSIGQLIFGPLSDSMGRKPVLFAWPCLHWHGLSGGSPKHCCHRIVCLFLLLKLQGRLSKYAPIVLPWATRS